ATAFADGQVTSIAVYPPDIHLNTKADLQRFIVVATRDDGVTLDVTKLAGIKLANAKLCTLDENILRPAADGQTTLDIEYQGFKTLATVEVKDASIDRPV